MREYSQMPSGDHLSEATEAEMPIEVRPYRDGLIVVAKQVQTGDRALLAHVVLCDIRELQDGHLKTTRMFHSPKGEFVYDAIQLRPVKQGEDDLHYGDEGQWWVVAPNGYLQIFWPDRTVGTGPRPQLPPGRYVADLRVHVGPKTRTFRTSFTVDAEHRATISPEQAAARDQEATSEATPKVADALVFDGYAAWRAGLALPGPPGFPAFAYVAVKNNQLSSAKALHNVRARIEYLHDGQPQFTVQTAAWWHDPKTPSSQRSWQAQLDLKPNESQCVPIYTQPDGSFLSNPSTWPQSARDADGLTQRLKPGRWKLLIAISADGAESIHGEVEFTIYEEISGAPLSIGAQPPMGAVRLPVQPEEQAPEPQSPVTPKQRPILAVWSWVGGKWQWVPLFGAGGTLVKFGEYGIGAFLLFLSAFAAVSKISHWRPAQGSPWPHRVFGYCLVSLGLFVAGLITLRMKGNDPWSHLLAAKARFVDPAKNQRPYVWVDRIIAKPSPTVGKPVFDDIYFVNYGNTPAKDLATFVHVDFGRPADQLCGSFRPNLEEQGAAVLGAGKTDIWKTAASVEDPLAKESRLKNWDGSTPIIVWGRMFYADFSGNHYTSTFCVEMLQGVTPMFVPGHNENNYFPAQNR